jgi:hypothetical protein
VRPLSNYRTDDPIVHAIYPASRYLSVTVRAFLDFLVNLGRHPILTGAAPHELVAACSISSGDPSLAGHHRFRIEQFPPFHLHLNQAHTSVG